MIHDLKERIDNSSVDTVPVWPDPRWSLVGPPYPTDLCIHQIIEDQVKRTPDATAVVFEADRLTYREFNRRANQLAHYLLELGVRPEVPVALFLERSTQLAVALMALLKAGAVNVPLDPDFPRDRLAFMLEDTRTRFVLTDSRHVHSLPRTSAAVLCLDREAPALSRQSADNPDSGVVVDNLCTYYYTSGSTGTPKAVMTTHRVGSRLQWSHLNAVKLDENDRTLVATSVGYGFFLGEFASGLMRGATAVLARPGGYQDVDYLVGIIERERITVISFVPSVLKHYLTRLKEQGFARGRSLRHIVSHGEPLPADLEEHLRTSFGARLHKFFGLTEAPVTAYWNGTMPEVAGRVMAGRPTDMECYLLDPMMKQVPVGEVGEIYISGPGLARGYLNRPGLTAERFLPNPFSREPGARLFRTGDFARWLPEGVIELLGRGDDLIKLRGLRVELGEIETTLARHPAVCEAAVVVTEERPGDKCIVAYVVFHDGQAASTDELNGFLARTLPEHMIPSAIVSLDRLPVLISGKINRAALAARARRGALYRAPRTHEERTLCHLFAGLLALEQVGVDDHFFELGGHSLLAARLVSRARAGLGVELTIRALFEAPTVAELAVRLRDMDKARAPLVRQARPERLPLSHAQARLWFLHRLEGRGPTYNIPVALRLDGDLDAAAMEAALADVVARHESLRTIFPDDGGAPFQQVLPAAEARPGLTIVRVSEADLTDGLSAAAATGIELTRELPLRAWLFRLAPQRHVLLVLVHHIAADGWSLGPLFEDLARAYTARLKGEEPAFAPLPVQYADYTVWQRGLLGEENDPDTPLAHQLDFWRVALEAAPEELQLPADRPRPPVGSYRGATVPVRLDADLHGRLLELARASGASLFMVLQAGLAALLSRLGAGDDIPIGCPVAGRGEHALEDLVGFFVNTLVLRTDVSGDPTFRELVGRVRAFDLEAYDYQDVPFERVVEAVQPARSLARHPLFQIMLVLQNAPWPEPALPGLAVHFEPLTLNVAKFDLTLGLRERVGPAGEPLGIDGALEYSQDLFDERTAQSIAAKVARLLAAAVATPDLPLHELEVVDADERHTLLEVFNATARPVPEATLPALFEAQVARTPDAAALIFDSQELSYGELNARANRLAHHLIGLGVAPESRVGVCLERSVEMVVALLGILKAGGAYVPLDPDYPQERLALMLRDSPGLVLSATSLPGRLPPAAKLVALDAHKTRAALDRAPAHDPTDCERRRPLRRQHPAYVIYTSGSAGPPKGVVVEHCALVNHMAWMGATYPVDRQDRVLCRTSINFDAAVWEFWLPLLSGAALCLAPAATRLDPPALLDYIDRSGVTIAQFVPTLLAAACDTRAPRSNRLRLVFSGGEALTRELANRLVKGWGVPVVNLYGPTETTIQVTHQRCPREVHDMSTIPIGAPIWNTRIYVLNAYLEPVPLGVPGELYVAGAGLARGYVNRPALTAERFVADPHNPRPGSRMYRTGDLARWRPDGTIEFMGRSDQQVKIRGFRIEPGEIEMALRGYETITEAVVVTCDDALRGKQLVAYVVAAPGATPSATELRNHLGALLPEYMVPAAFVVLDALPLTPGGKLDRRALPHRGATRPDVDTTFTPSGSPTEELLARIWCELLGLDRVGIRDDFFELGGHSLLVLRLWSRIKESFGRELPVKLFFRHRTIEHLALILQEQATAKSPGDDRADSALADTQRPLLFCLDHSAAALAPHLDDLPISPIGFFADEDLISDLDSVEERAKVYIKRLRDQQPAGPYRLVGFCGSALVAFEMARQLSEQGDAVPLLVLAGPRHTGITTGASATRRSKTIRYYRVRLGHHLSKLAHVSPRQWPAYCLERVLSLLRAIGVKWKIVPDPVDASDFWSARPQLLTALSTYRPESYPGKVTLMVASQRVAAYGDSDFGWRSVAGGGLDVHIIPGDQDRVLGPDVRLMAGPLKAVYHESLERPTDFRGCPTGENR